MIHAAGGVTRTPALLLASAVGAAAWYGSVYAAAHGHIGLSAGLGLILLGCIGLAWR